VWQECRSHQFQSQTVHHSRPLLQSRSCIFQTTLPSGKIPGTLSHGQPKEDQGNLNPPLLIDTKKKSSFSSSSRPFSRTPVSDCPDYKEVMVYKRDMTLKDAEDPIPEVVRQMLVVTQLIMDTGGSIIIHPEKRLSRIKVGSKI